METQASSLTTLQNTLVNMASSAGKPYDDTNRRQIQATQEQQRLERNQRNMVMQDELRNLSKQLQEEMRRINTNIDFSYNEEIRALVVTVRDSTGERVIREIPSKEAIELMRKMRDLIGNIFEERV